MDEKHWKFMKNITTKNHRIQNFMYQSKKLAEAGISFGSEFAHKIQIVLT